MLTGDMVNIHTMSIGQFLVMVVCYYDKKMEIKGIALTDEESLSIRRSNFSFVHSQLRDENYT